MNCIFAGLLVCWLIDATVKHPCPNWNSNPEHLTQEPNWVSENIDVLNNNKKIKNNHSLM